MSESEIIQNLIKTNKESIAALRMLLNGKSTTTKKHTRSDSELVDELFAFDSSVIDLTKMDCVLNGRDFTIEN